MTARVDTQSAKERAEWWLSQDPIWRRERGFGYATGFAETTLALAGLLADAEKALWDAPCDCDEAPAAHLSGCYIARYFARRAAFDAAGGAGT